VEVEGSLGKFGKDKDVEGCLGKFEEVGEILRMFREV
jgi:hypothetical protein